MFQFQFGRERVCIYIHSWRVASALSLKIPSARTASVHIFAISKPLSRRRRLMESHAGGAKEFLIHGVMTFSSYSRSRADGFWGDLEMRERATLSPDGRGMLRRFLNIHRWCAPAPGWANADKLLIIHRPYAIPFHAGIEYIYIQRDALRQEMSACVRAGGWKSQRPRDPMIKRVSNAFTHSLNSRRAEWGERSNLKWRVFVQLRWKNCARARASWCLMHYETGFGKKGGYHLRRFVPSQTF